MPAPFEPLRERLLRAGVAPARVRRYLRELSEHLRDLVDEELDAGRTPAAAEDAARVRLGGEEALAEAMLAQPSSRSWTARAPWATLVVGPFLLLIVAWLAACLGMLLLVGRPADANGLYEGPAWLPREWLPREWAMGLGTALLDLVQFGGPILIASWVALLAARQRSHVIWPALGCVAVALFGASLYWGVHWPAVDPRDPLHRISWSLSLGFRGHSMSNNHHAFSVAVWSQSLVRGALNVAVAGAAYWMARGRRPTAA